MSVVFLDVFHFFRFFLRKKKLCDKNLSWLSRSFYCINSYRHISRSDWNNAIPPLDNCNLIIKISTQGMIRFFWKEGRRMKKLHIFERKQKIQKKADFEEPQSGQTQNVLGSKEDKRKLKWGEKTVDCDQAFWGFIGISSY